eukprot:6990362-Pyramimonas_sp.AAC.2
MSPQRRSTSHHMVQELTDAMGSQIRLEGTFPRGNGARVIGGGEHCSADHLAGRPARNSPFCRGGPCDFWGRAHQFQSDAALAVEHRLGKAGAQHWGRAKVSRSGRSIKSELKARRSGRAAGAILGAQSGHISRHFGRSLKICELQFLRRTLRLRRGPAEGAMATNWTRAQYDAILPPSASRSVFQRLKGNIFPRGRRAQRRGKRRGGSGPASVGGNRFSVGYFRKRRRLGMPCAARGGRSRLEFVFCE